MPKAKPISTVTGHEISHRESPTHRMAMCSCGWVGQQQRQGQNARAAVKKLQGAVTRHMRDVAARQKG